MTSPQDPWQQGGYPQQPQGGPQYPGQSPQSGQYPQPGYDVPHSAPPPPGPGGGYPRPWQVEVAFWIAIVAPLVVTVLTVIGFVLGQGVVEDAVRTSLEQQPGAVPPEALRIGQAVALFVLVLQIFVYLVLTGLWILFGFKMRAGRHWARVTLTVFAGLWALTSLFSLIGGGGQMQLESGGAPMSMDLPTSMVALGYVQQGLGLVAMIAFLVLIYLRQSNWFFQAARYRG